MQYYSTLILASEIKIGNQLADGDGYLWDVIEVFRNEATTTVRICSDFSLVQNSWTIKKDGTKGGHLLTFDNSSFLRGIKV